jgi:hypothetical protein
MENKSKEVITMKPFKERFKEAFSLRGLASATIAATSAGILKGAVPAGAGLLVIGAVSLLLWLSHR